MDGYIKLYRELLEKPIWLNSTPEQKTILIALLLKANHKTKSWEWKGKKFNVLPGQFVTSLNSIRQLCGKGISGQNIRTALVRFEKLQFLTNKSTKMGRVISIMNWDSYQPKNKKLTKILTDGSQRPNKDLTPNKNERMKEREKEKKKNTKKKSFKTYLKEKIIQHNFIEIKDNIFEFYNYRMNMAASNRYKSEKGINGLFRDLLGCRKAGLVVSDCIEEAMERDWKTPKPNYFSNHQAKINQNAGAMEWLRQEGEI